MFPVVNYDWNERRGRQMAGIVVLLVYIAAFAALMLWQAVRPKSQFLAS